MRICIESFLSIEEKRTIESFLKMQGFKSKIDGDSTLFFNDENSEKKRNEIRFIWLSLLFNNSKGVTRNFIKRNIRNNFEDLIMTLQGVANSLGMELLNFEDNYILAVHDKYKDAIQEELSNINKAILVYIIIQSRLDKDILENHIINLIKNSLGYKSSQIKSSFSKLEKRSYIRRFITNHGKFVSLGWKALLLDQRLNLELRVTDALEDWIEKIE